MPCGGTVCTITPVYCTDSPTTYNWVKYSLMAAAVDGLGIHNDFSLVWRLCKSGLAVTLVFLVNYLSPESVLYRLLALDNVLCVMLAMSSGCWTHSPGPRGPGLGCVPASDWWRVTRLASDWLMVVTTHTTPWGGESSQHMSAKVSTDTFTIR